MKNSVHTESTMPSPMLITVAEDEQQQQRQPFLQHSSPPTQYEEEINYALPLSSKPPPPKQPNQRLHSLDIFRGLTVSLMIFVDDIVLAFPSMNHAPWFGATLADFVMPSFLFIVGVSIGLSFQKVSNKSVATKKVILRTIKLFLIGLLLQGGYFHGSYNNNLTYGVDVRKIRWMGVLQRISIGYFLASMSEIWLVDNITVDSPVAFVKRYYIQWMFAFFLCSFYMCLLYGLYVPDWEFEVPSTYPYGHGSGIQTQSVTQMIDCLVTGIMTFFRYLGRNDTQDIAAKPVSLVHCPFAVVTLLVWVKCGVKGSLEPPCNAAGLIDRLFLGQYHLQWYPDYLRMKQCSVSSPNYGPLPPNSPGWCLAPFEPEGILSSLMASITCFLGLQFGHIIVYFKGNMQRLVLWSMSSFAMLITGYVLKLLGIPICKLLYTLSYMFITAGASGLVLTIIFYMVDVKQFRKPMLMLQWMGMNTLVIYVCASVFPSFLQGFYWGSPENNLVDGTQSLMQAVLHSEKWGILALVIVNIVFWCLVSGFLHMKGIYVKM